MEGKADSVNVENKVRGIIVEQLAVDENEVRRVGNRTIDYRLDAHFAEYRCQFHTTIQEWHEPLEVAGEQLPIKSPVHALQRPRFRAEGFVGADQQPLAFLANVGAAVRVANHRQFGFQLLNARVTLGDQVLMFQVDDWQ